VRRDPDRFVYSPIVQRPRIEWPGGARLAFWIATNHEFYELDPPLGKTRKPWPRVQPDVLAYSQRDYGNRVGIWRLLELVDRWGVRGSISWNVALGDHHPETTEPFLERGWEFFSHGTYNTRYLFELSEAQERAVIEDSIETIARLTGQGPTGFLAPALTYTERTFDLLAEYGFLYTCDLFHDDQPFPVQVRSGRLVSVPYTLELNDVYAYNYFLYPPDEYGRMIREQFDVLHAEGGRVMCTAIHPYLVNQPHRQRAYEEAIEYVLGHDDVWVTTGAEIARWYYDRYYDEVAAAAGRPPTEGRA
jgi:allantoinase